jgi:nucleoside-diphosphate-sugar epimerase
MKVFLAGAAGAIGRPLVANLIAAGHRVTGMTRSERGGRLLAELGANSVIVDALNATAIRAAIDHARPDVVIDELTSLPQHYTKEALQAAFGTHRRLRLEGGANLQRAAEAMGARRYIVQSGAFLAAPGPGLAEESALFAVQASPGAAATAQMFAEVERRALRASRLEVVVLRYGIFYGPGAWFARDGDMADQARQGRIPVAGDGQGVWSFIHVEDAAAATVAALECEPGIYNVVDDHPSELGVWLPAFAQWVGAEPPVRLSEAEALRMAGADFVYYATRLRGASNAKARAELEFRPRQLEWLAAGGAPAVMRA